MVTIRTRRTNRLSRFALFPLVLGICAIAHAADDGPVATGNIAGEPQLALHGIDGARVVEHLRGDEERGIPPILIVDQTDPPNGLWVNSQVVAEAPEFDAFAFDDFTVHQEWLLDQLVVFGSEQGDPLCNLDVVAEIWEGRPGDGGFPIMQALGNQIGNDLIFNFGFQPLPPGEYLITAFVVRPFDDGLCQGGQWGIQQTAVVRGREQGVWNPGGGYGVGPEIGKASDLVFQTGLPGDLRFQLYGLPFNSFDCNSNGVEDFLDIANGDSFDTNKNGIPDECERDGLGGVTADFDLDGVPDVSDSKPTVYAHVEPGTVVTAAFLSQLSFPATDYAEAAADTEHGAVTLVYPTEPTVHLYINVEVDGVWAVQNKLVYTEALATDEPEQSATFYFDLGTPRGVVVPTADVRWWIDPIGFTSPPPAGSPAGSFPVTLPVTPENYRVGHMSGAPDPVPVPGPENPAAPAPEPKEKKTTVTNDGLEVTDLDRSWERNSCAPNAVGGSFHWLNKTYGLGLTGTLDQLVQEFRRLMGTLNGKGTTLRKKLEAKKAFIRKHKLPLTVESRGIPLDLDDTATPDDLMRELSQGQDVEIGYGFYKKDAMGKWKRSGGHTVAIKSITKCEKDGVVTWTITFRHDWKQGEAGGVADVPVKITSETKDFDNDGTNETVWVLDNGPFGAKDKTRIVEEFTSESPTVSLLNKLISDALDAYSAVRAGIYADGVATLPEAQAGLAEAQKLKKLWQRFLDNVKLLNPPRPELVNSGTRGLKSACNLRDSWARRVKSLGGKSDSRSVLPEDLEAMSILEEDSMRLADLPQMAADLAPDLDLDDIEDGLDNAPLDANNDQADEDNNGTPDVVELSPVTDCNDNGIIDAYEVTIFDVVDYNFDGTPNLGFIYDLDMSGIPDDCETPVADCIGDVDGDDDTDVFDFGILASNFGQSVPIGTLGDLDLNGVVNVFDFGILATDFGCN